MDVNLAYTSRADSEIFRRELRSEKTNAYIEGLCVEQLKIQWVLSPLGPSRCSNRNSLKNFNVTRWSWIHISPERTEKLQHCLQIVKFTITVKIFILARTIFDFPIPRSG